jgi:uncharacterized protein (DUF2225 family)
MLEKENMKKDEVISRLLEKTKYCPTTATGNDTQTMQRKSLKDTTFYINLV